MPPTPRARPPALALSIDGESDTDTVCMVTARSRASSPADTVFTAPLWTGAARTPSTPKHIPGAWDERYSTPPPFPVPANTPRAAGASGTIGLGRPPRRRGSHAGSERTTTTVEYPDGTRVVSGPPAGWVSASPPPARSFSTTLKYAFADDDGGACLAEWEAHPGVEAPDHEWTEFVRAEIQRMLFDGVVAATGQPVQHEGPGLVEHMRELRAEMDSLRAVVAQVKAEQGSSLHTGSTPHTPAMGAGHELEATRLQEQPEAAHAHGVDGQQHHQHHHHEQHHQHDGSEHETRHASEHDHDSAHHSASEHDSHSQHESAHSSEHDGPLHLTPTTLSLVLEVVRAIDRARHVDHRPDVAIFDDDNLAAIIEDARQVLDEEGVSVFGGSVRSALASGSDGSGSGSQRRRLVPSEASVPDAPDAPDDARTASAPFSPAVLAASPGTITPRPAQSPEPEADARVMAAATPPDDHRHITTPPATST
ncbi:hypothetical protein Q8F55_000318 [Vanrija albida]|uniref:Uncharacterized protein n=1 Tax=Vanrija albida TaxID=181172 RepID=A0ABR3QCX7_9TREE